jgi:hypothetical protein
MSCVALPKIALPPAPPADTSWEGIAEAVRAHAAAQAPGDAADDLYQWADFIDGVAEYQRRTGRR